MCGDAFLNVHCFGRQCWCFFPAAEEPDDDFSSDRRNEELCFPSGHKTQTYINTENTSSNHCGHDGRQILTSCFYLLHYGISLFPPVFSRFLVCIPVFPCIFLYFACIFPVYLCMHVVWAWLPSWLQTLFFLHTCHQSAYKLAVHHFIRLQFFFSLGSFHIGCFCHRGNANPNPFGSALFDEKSVFCSLILDCTNCLFLVFRIILVCLACPQLLLLSPPIPSHQVRLNKISSMSSVSGLCWLGPLSELNLTVFLHLLK